MFLLFAVKRFCFIVLCNQNEKAKLCRPMYFSPKYSYLRSTRLKFACFMLPFHRDIFLIIVCITAGNHLSNHEAHGGA